MWCQAPSFTEKQVRLIRKTNIEICDWVACFFKHNVRSHKVAIGFVKGLCISQRFRQVIVRTLWKLIN